MDGGRGLGLVWRGNVGVKHGRVAWKGWNDGKGGWRHGQEDGWRKRK